MVFEYKGYTLVQEEEINHHYMIIDENDRMCMHASYEGDLLTEKEAQNIISAYINLASDFPDIEE